jgi:hypothetical protein
MFLEQRCDDLSIWVGAPRNWTQLLVELVAAPGRVDNNDLAGLIREVQEGVWNP